jgi:hypothetical protein
MNNSGHTRHLDPLQEIRDALIGERAARTGDAVVIARAQGFVSVSKSNG